MGDKYIREQSFYEDLYDLHTIEECIRMESRKSDLSNKQIQKLKMSVEKAQQIKSSVNELFVYFYKGDRYSKRQSTIDEWMQKDQHKQDFYDNSREPSIFCDHCDSPSFVIEKILEDYLDKELKVLYMFECPDCHKRECYYEDSEKKVFEKELCPTCKIELKRSHSEKDGVHKTTSKCSGCDYKEVDVYDLKKNKIEREKKEKYHAKLLRKYRKKYCLSFEEGSRFEQDMANFKHFADLVKEKEIKEADPVYSYISKIRKLTIFQLEESLSKRLKGTGFVKLNFGEPEMTKDVVVSFTLQDSKQRESRESEYDLKKLIKGALKDTNWQLMSEGVSYRMGLLSGRVRGYEREEDLYKIAKKMYKSSS